MADPGQNRGRGSRSEPAARGTDSADVVAQHPARKHRSMPMLLQGQDYFFRSPGNVLDFQERMHRSGMVAEFSADPVPCVLVLARADDMEMNELSLALAEVGIRMVRLDADRCLDVALTVYTDAPLVEYEQWLLRPMLVWRRHFDLTALPVDATTVQGAYVHEQWRAVAGWLSGRGDWEQINPFRTTQHLDRLTQLSDAASFGLTVPRTTVTTLPGRNRPGGASCIVKTAGKHLLEPEPGELRGLFPRPLDTRRVGEALEPAPVLVQQYLSSEYELRVFVVGEDVLAYRVEKVDPAELWVDPDAVSVTPVEVPNELGEKLLGLSRHWRLHVAAFDILVAGGDFVFLEVNVNCDWRWFERRAGCGAVSEAVHRWVASRFEELVSAPRRSGTRH